MRALPPALASARAIHLLPHPSLWRAGTARPTRAARPHLDTRHCALFQLTKLPFLNILFPMHVLPSPSLSRTPPAPPTHPARKHLPHDAQPFPGIGEPVHFITACARTRSGGPFLPAADAILAAARHCHERGRWFLRLLLVMPDHVHALVTMPRGSILTTTVANWKHYLARTASIAFQRDFFDHRLRGEAEVSGKYAYIRANPVRKGLVAHPDDWSHWVAFHPLTGESIRG